MLGAFEFTIGPFLIHYSIPGAIPGRCLNMQIWPAGAQEYGRIVQGNKLVNVDWNHSNLVDIISFRSGDWEKDLLALVADANTIEFFPRRG